MRFKTECVLVKLSGTCNLTSPKWLSPISITSRSFVLKFYAYGHFLPAGIYPRHYMTVTQIRRGSNMSYIFWCNENWNGYLFEITPLKVAHSDRLDLRAVVSPMVQTRFWNYSIMKISDFPTSRFFKNLLIGFYWPPHDVHNHSNPLSGTEMRGTHWHTNVYFNRINAPFNCIFEFFSAKRVCCPRKFLQAWKSAQRLSLHPESHPLPLSCWKKMALLEAPMIP